MSTSKQHPSPRVHVSIAGVPFDSVRRFWASLFLHTTCMHLLSLLFGFCAARMLSYKCLQMEWWAAVTVVAIPAQPALLMWLCVLHLPDRQCSYLGPLEVRQQIPCWLHLAYLGQKTGCWRIVCHCHPQSFPSLPWDFFVTQMLAQHKPSCILS